MLAAARMRGRVVVFRQEDGLRAADATGAAKRTIAGDICPGVAGAGKAYREVNCPYRAGVNFWHVDGEFWHVVGHCKTAEVRKHVAAVCLYATDYAHRDADGFHAAAGVRQGHCIAVLHHRVQSEIEFADVALQYIGSHGIAVAVHSHREACRARWRAGHLLVEVDDYRIAGDIGGGTVQRRNCRLSRRYIGSGRRGQFRHSHNAGAGVAVCCRGDVGRSGSICCHQSAGADSGHGRRVGAPGHVCAGGIGRYNCGQGSSLSYIQGQGFSAQSQTDRSKSDRY